MTLAAFSRMNYVLFPPVRPQWVYVGDAFRVLCHSVLLLAAVREIYGYWQRLADTAVLDERRGVRRRNNGFVQAADDDLGVDSRSAQRGQPRG